jgi:2'-5' RNA ligase
MKKILTLLILCSSALYGIKKGDMLVSIPYVKGSSVVRELVGLQRNFEFTSKPRDYQFHTTIAYIENVYSGDYVKGHSPEPELISEALMGRRRWEDVKSDFDPLKYICNLKLGKLQLFGNQVVVVLEGEGVEELARLHENVAEMSNALRVGKVSQKHADYIPHISLGQINPSQRDDLKEIINSINDERGAEEDFCVDKVRLSFENKKDDKPLEFCYFDL